jgi:hypothetical protein
MFIENSNGLLSLLSYGNSKLPKSTAIFNMCSAESCPSDKLGLCQLSKFCYAKKAERLYPSVLPYRNRQAEYWFNCTAEKFCSDFLEAISHKQTKITALRVSESGDFNSQADVNKLADIAEILYTNGIKVYCHTARKDLNFDNCRYLQVIGSNFMGDISFIGIKNASQAAKDLRSQGHKAALCAGSCKKCSLCQTAKDLVVYCELH